MSNDLISRSALMSKLLINSKGQAIPEVDCDNFSINLSIREVKDLVGNQSTAYDVDAVIAKLEKGLQNAKIHKEKHSYSDEFINGFINGYERALDVVKKGGRNDK